jgi:hypothetical protein
MQLEKEIREINIILYTAPFFHGFIKGEVVYLTEAGVGRIDKTKNKTN